MRVADNSCPTTFPPTLVLAVCGIASTPTLVSYVACVSFKQAHH